MTEKKRENVEILAPAGSIETLYADVAMGADAVYVGTDKFGARAFADNPSVEELEKAIKYCHVRNKKIYLTVNTLLNDYEIENELIPMIRPLYEAGLDACIVQDMGVLSVLNTEFPDMDIHASTQMALFSGKEAEILKPFGVTRYVPARELSIDEIRRAREQTDLEIEVFVHGALCVCYSGWCHMSEVIGGRSGNRGMCAGPCRLKWTTKIKPDSGENYYESVDNSGFFLNTRDICTLFYIPEMIDAGIDSFKIEGRMKSREYASYNAYLYRKYADYYFEKGRENFEKLVSDKNSELWRDFKRSSILYNRGGFFPSFLFCKSGSFPGMNKTGSGHKNVDKGSFADCPKPGKDSTTIEKTRKGHYGLKVGEVRRTGKGFAVFIASEDLYSGDVIEFRMENGLAGYEITLGRDCRIAPNALKRSKNTNKSNDLAINSSNNDMKNNTAMKNNITDGYVLYEKGTELKVNTGRGKVFAGQKVFCTKSRYLDELIGEKISKGRDELVVGLRGTFRAFIGERVSFSIERMADNDLSLNCNGENPDGLLEEGKKRVVTVYGDIVQEAGKRPVSENDIVQRICSTGGGDYLFEDVDIEISDNAFIPLGEIKKLRRNAIAKWENEVSRRESGAHFAGEEGGGNVSTRQPAEGLEQAITENRIFVYISDYLQYDGVVRALSDAKNNMFKAGQLMDRIKQIIFSSTYGNCFDLSEGNRSINEKKDDCENDDENEIVLAIDIAGFSPDDWPKLCVRHSGVEMALVLPAPLRGKAKSFFDENIKKYRELTEFDWDYLVINSFAGLLYRDCFSKNIKCVAGENLYMTNCRAGSFFEKMGILPHPDFVMGSRNVMTTVHELPEAKIISPKGDTFFVKNVEGYDYRLLFTSSVCD